MDIKRLIRSRKELIEKDIQVQEVHIKSVSRFLNISLEGKGIQIQEYKRWK